MSAPSPYPQNDTPQNGTVTDMRGTPVVYVPETPPAVAIPPNAAAAGANASRATAAAASSLTPIVINETIDYPTPPPPSIPQWIRPARPASNGNNDDGENGGRVRNAATTRAGAPRVQTSSLSRPGTTDNGSSTAVEEPLSSPINVSFTSSITPSATPSPSVRAATFRARNGGDPTARGAGTNVREEGAAPTAARSLASFTLPSSPSTTHGNQQDGEDDYFRYFTTPPASAPPPPQSQQHELQPPQLHYGHGENAVDAQKIARDLENSAMQTMQDDPRTARKRFWAGTPDPEGEERASRRLRPTGTTPAFRNDARLPSASLMGPNPWASDRTIGTNATDNNRVAGNFSPIAASTPFPTNASLEIPPLTQLSLSRASAALVSPQAHAMPRPRRDAHDRNSGPPSPPSQMNVDGNEAQESDPSSDTSPMPKKNKGKGRATTEDLAHHDEELEDELSPDDDAAEEEVWNERELAQARQESLRQVLQDRAGPSHAERRDYRARTSAAGPSGFGQRAYTSRDEASNSRRREDSSHHAHPRLPSEFLPLPNTRAANYLAARHPEAYALPQRSPPSRVHGLQRSLSPPLVPYGEPSFFGNTISGGQERTYWNDAHRDDASRMDEEDDDADALDARDERWGSQTHSRDWREDEEGEIAPTCLRDDEPLSNALPTLAPHGGFPTLHRDDPETVLRGMALGWIREIWQDAPNSDVLVQVYNYRYTEDDTLNRRVAEALRWAFEHITGERGFDVVPPELEEGTRARGRDLPSIWAIRGLSSTATLTAISGGTWSFDRISFAALPRSTTPQNWLFALDGYLEGNASRKPLV